MGRDQEKSSSGEAVTGQVNSAVQPETKGRFAEFLLLATGLLQFLTGAALIIVPSALPQYAWVVHGLARRGITGLPLYVGGVVLTGLWLSTRSNRARSSWVRESSAAASAAIVQLANEVGHLGDGLQGLRIEFVYLKDALQTQLENAQSNTSTNANTDNQSDGMYRLAASLDQLGARIEERLNASHRELGQALQAVASKVESIESLAAAPQIQLVEAGESRLEETSSRPRHVNSGGSDTASAHTDDSWDHDESERHHRLGLLDMLDDLGRILPRKTSPSVDRPTPQTRIETDPFEAIQDEGWEHAASIPGPIPASRAGDELHLAGAGGLLGGSPHVAGSLEDAPLDDKLAELRSLLADVRVREALATLERIRK